MATFKKANARTEAYLVTTAYAGTASTDHTTNVSRWLKDSTQAGATTQSATQRYQALLSNAAGL